MLSLIALLAITCYLVASAVQARPLVGGRESGGGLASTTAAAGVLAHAGVLLGMHRGALDLHFFAALSLVGCVVSALTLVVNLSRPVAALGVIVFPLSALLLGIDVFVAAPTTPQPLGWQIKLHVSVALLAFQERALRHRQFGALLRALPPLTLTETLLFRLIGAGFALLTLTLLTGILFVDDLFGQHLIHKTVLSIVAWIVFGVLLAGRWRYGWRGRRAVNLTLAGMAILLLAFFGTKFVLEVVLHRT